MDSKGLRSLMEAYQQISAPQEVEEGVRDLDPEKGTAERKASLEKKRGMKVDDHPQYKEEDKVDEAMSSYDRNRKRAAQRAAARNAARDAGKTGVVPGVGYVTPRRERETYVDSAGTTRHKSGARMEEVENVEEGLRDKVGEKVKKHVNKYAYKQGIHNNPGWLRKPEKRAALNKAVRDDIKKNPKAAVQYAAGEVKRKVKEKLRKEEYLDETGKRDQGIRDRIKMFKKGNIEYTPPRNWDPDANRGKGATVSPKQAEKRRRKALRSEEFDAFDVILEFLIDEEIAQDIQEANWIMANAITEEQIDEILGMFKKNPEKKIEYAGRSMEPVKKDPGYTVDKRRPEVSVSTYGKGGRTDKFKTRGGV